MMVLGTFTLDAVDLLMRVQFGLAQRYDVMVSFFEPTSARSLHELERLPGVAEVEPFRSVPARLRLGHRSRVAAILGLPENPRLNRVLDVEARPVRFPPGGLILSRKLGEILGARPGDAITLEVLEGGRPVHRVVVSALVDEFLGTSAYMEAGSLHRLLREGESLSGAYLAVDREAEARLHRRLKAIPRVAGVLVQRAGIESFKKTLAENVARVRAINIAFAAVIAFGVVYNTARISLSERSRELATLRVIGFRRREISAILLGELAVLTAVAVPVGLVLGYLMAAGAIRAYETELFRIPLVVAPRTYALAAVTTLAAAVLSGLAVRRRLDRLDLIAVLKTRE
jgi:putative ABC transport system permease protein